MAPVNGDPTQKLWNLAPWNDMIICVATVWIDPCTGLICNIGRELCKLRCQCMMSRMQEGGVKTTAWKATKQPIYCE